MHKINIWVRQNLLFVIAASLATIAVILGQFDPTYIKYDVLVSLFGLMIVLAFFQTSGLLRWASIKLIDWSGNSRVIVQSMVLASFFGSFLLSNDIAVLTLLPIYLNILRHLPAFKGRTRGSPDCRGRKPRRGLLPFLQPTKSHHLFNLSSRFRQLHVVDPTPGGCRLYPCYGRNALRREKGSPHTS